MEVRRATVDDWEASRDLRLRALAEAPDAFLSTLEREVAFDDAVWKSRLTNGYTAFALKGAVVVGTAALIEDPHETGSREIVGMWVDPDFRRTGIAAALVTHLVDHAREQDAAAVALWVADGNDGARRVYAKCGFSATGERDVIRPGLGEERMRLRLRSGTTSH